MDDAYTLLSCPSQLAGVIHLHPTHFHPFVFARSNARTDVLFTLQARSSPSLSRFRAFTGTIQVHSSSIRTNEGTSCTEMHRCLPSDRSTSFPHGLQPSRTDIPFVRAHARARCLLSFNSRTRRLARLRFAPCTGASVFCAGICISLCLRPPAPARPTSLPHMLQPSRTDTPSVRAHAPAGCLLSFDSRTLRPG